MKFNEVLNASLTPEWKSQYLVYKELKDIIYSPEKPALTPGNLSNNDLLCQREDFYAETEVKFFEVLNDELEKINNFFAEKLAESKRKLAELKTQLKTLKHVDDCINKMKGKSRGSMKNILKKNDGNLVKLRLRNISGDYTFDKIEGDPGAPINNNETYVLTEAINKFSYKRKLDSYERVFTEFYLSLVLLSNYQELNYTGFRKILKKHDKEWQLTTGHEYFTQVINITAFHTNKDVPKMIHEVEELFVKEFSENDRSYAMDRLRVPPLSQKDKKFSLPSWLAGFFASTSLFLLIFSIVASFYTLPEQWKLVGPMFRGQFVITLYITLLSMNVFIWRKAGVNHVLIFELNPRNNLSFIQIMALGFISVTIVLLFACGYVFHELFNISPQIFPALSLLTLLFFWINPFYVCHRDARYWLLRIFGRNLLAGWIPVYFADFWLGDQLNSLVGPMGDIQLILCHFCFDYNRLTNMCLNPRFPTKYMAVGLPYYIRMMQCFRRYYDTRRKVHIFNGLKYFSSVISMLFLGLYEDYRQYRIFTALLILTKFSASTYLSIWDISIDWGLIYLHNGKLVFRKHRIYKRTWVYIVSIVYDVLVRYSWFFGFINTETGIFNTFYLELFIQLVDGLRRFIWNLYRVENEHLNNVGEFRATRDISIKPLIRKAESSLNVVSSHQHLQVIAE